MTDKHFTTERVKEIRERVAEGQKIFRVVKKIGTWAAIALALFALILHSQYKVESPEGKRELKKEKFERAVENAQRLIVREAERRALTCGNFFGMNSPQCRGGTQGMETPSLPPPNQGVACPKETTVTLAPGQLGRRMARIIEVPTGCVVSVETNPRAVVIDIGKGGPNASFFEKPDFGPADDWRAITGDGKWLWARNRSSRAIYLTVRMWPSIGE